MVLINTIYNEDEHVVYCYTCIVAYKNNHLHAVSLLGIAFVLSYHVHLKFLHIHRHLTDDLLDLQVANGFIVDNDHKKHFLTLILNVL